MALMTFCRVQNTSMTGIVVGADSTPISGAIVSIQGTELEAVTENTGRFTFEHLPLREESAEKVIQVYHHAYKPLSIGTTLEYGDIDIIQIQAIDYESSNTLIEINNRFQFMQVHILKWPEDLQARLGDLKNHAYMAFPRNKPPRKLPLLIALHGGGGKGFNLEEMLLRSSNVKGLALAEMSKKDLILLEPTSYKQWDPNTLNVMLDYVLDTYKDIDKQKVYLVGHSMGGSGTWNWINRSPERFAAASPGAQSGDKGPYDAIKDLPLWFMIAESDNGGKLEGGGGNILAEGVMKATNTEVKLTVFPGADHAGANKGMFTHPELVEWMLQFSIPN